MKVILISAVANLGQIGDVVEVKNGYARNFLIPNKKAICFTESNNKLFEEKRQQFEKENQNNLDSANKVKTTLLGKDVIVIESASDDGRLYGSVNAAVIASKVNEIVGLKSVSRNEVFLEKPIKDIGIYKVLIVPHTDVSFSIRLIVTRSESEIDALIKAEKDKLKAQKEKEKEEKKAEEVKKESDAKEEKQEEVVEEKEEVAA